MKNGKIDKFLFGGGYAQASVASSTTDNFAFYFYNQDHLGNIREVVNASGSVQQVTNYYPFGAPYADASASTNTDFLPYKYNGKEFDKMHGLNTYDYGVRQYNPVTARWDRMDPLAEKYYGLSPYVYCANNPVNAIDPDGRDVHPADSAAYFVILNTLHPDDRQYVLLDKNGNIDFALMKAHKSNSTNYKCLLDLVSSDLVFNVNIQENYADYMNDQGESGDNGLLSYCEPDNSFKDTDFSSSSGLTTGESGKYGITLLPGNGNSGVNSVDNAVHVFIHPSLSKIGRSEALSHELYGHGYIYHKYRDRNVSAHHFKGTVDTNKILKQQIIQARKETVSYF